MDIVLENDKLGGSEQDTWGWDESSGQAQSVANSFDAQMSRICQVFHVSRDIDLAKAFGKAQTTISSVRVRKSIPAKWLKELNAKHDISINWLLDGTGPMKVIQATESLSVPMEAIKKPADNAPAPGSFKVSEDLTAAAEVLESGTAYATALHLNIQQFHRAIKDQTGIQRLQQTITDQAEITRVQGETIRAQAQTIAVLQSTMAQESAAMRKEVEELKSQLARLLATGADNPDHGQEVA
jgi:hypothetical protein